MFTIEIGINQPKVRREEPRTWTDEMVRKYPNLAGCYLCGSEEGTCGVCDQCRNDN